MKYCSTMLVVKDIEKSKQFYKNILGLDVVDDFGANVVLTGGIALQTQESWLEFIHKNETEVNYGANNMELYFEEDNFDSFINSKLKANSNITYVHDVKEHSWGQRVVRFYDIDKHIIEVGENMIVVVKRFVDSGLSIADTAKRMDVSIEYVESCLKPTQQDD